jgi:hypothetical protein
MPREYAEGLHTHKQALFNDFLQMIPAIEAAFPHLNIVVRPHPTENQDVYQRLANRLQRVRVTNAGNVVSWLLATRALIHNGCTTGVEAYVMGVPAVSFRPTVDNYYDDGFYQLPNRLSHQCFDQSALEAKLTDILEGRTGAADGPERRTIVGQYLAGLEGPLACERIVDVLGRVTSGLADDAGPSRRDRLEGWYKTTKRRVRQRIKAHLPGSAKSPAFERHRYPELAPEEVEARLERFQGILAGARPLRVERIFKKLYRIRA